MRALRSISLQRWLQGNLGELSKLSEACRTDGFFYLVDHGVPRETFLRTFSAADRFFTSPGAVKDPTHWSQSKVYPLTVPNRGWVGTLEERLGPYAGSSLEQKEAFDWAYDLPANGNETPFHGPNSWPDLPSGEFRQPLEDFRDSLMVVAKQLLQMFCCARGVQATALDQEFSNPTFICRVLNYPAKVEDHAGCNPHTDNGWFTLLAQDDQGGLQARLGDGDEWVDVEPRLLSDNALVVNIGDALSAHTNGEWRSTLHQVMPPASGHRTSAALFFDPNASSRVFSPCQDINEAVKVLMHKAGYQENLDDLRAMHGLSFAAYKERVFTKFLPEEDLYEDFTDSVKSHSHA